MGKKDQVTCVSVHAIPVFDGHLIQSESDIHDNLIDAGEMNVELINDFEIPWVLKKTINYPKYRRIRRKKKVAAEGEEGEDEEDYGDEDDEKDPQGSDDEEEEEMSERSRDDSDV